MSLATQDQVRAFYDFLGEQLAAGRAPPTPEESVEAFRQYQDELRRFTAGTVQALAQSESGQTRPLDVDAIFQRVQSRLQQNGHVA